MTVWRALLALVGAVGLAVGSFIGLRRGKAKGKREGRETAVQEGEHADQKRANEIRSRSIAASGMRDDTDRGYRD